MGLDEIAENEFNLNIPRFVDTFEPEPRVEVKDALKALGDAESAVKDAERELDELSEIDRLCDRLDAAHSIVLRTGAPKGWREVRVRRHCLNRRRRNT